MFTGDVFELLKHVITSWQVIVVTLVVIIYLRIVTYMARSYRRPQSIKKLSFKKKKAPTPPAESMNAVLPDTDSSVAPEEET